MKKVIFFLLLFYVTIILYGCKDNIVENTLSNSNFIKRIVVSNDNFTEYFYNNNLLIKKVQVSDGETILLITFTYDKSNRLIKSDELANFDGFLIPTRSTYEYDTNNLMVKSYFLRQIQDSNYERISYKTYEYKNDKIIRYNLYDTNNVLTSYHTFKYDTDNIIKEIHFYVYSNTQLIETFEYDNKLNPTIKDISFISAFTISKNNVIKWTSTYYTITPPNIYIDESSYVYNHLGYPIKCTTVYNRNENGIKTQYTGTSYYEYY